MVFNFVVELLYSGYFLLLSDDSELDSSKEKFESLGSDSIFSLTRILQPE